MVILPFLVFLRTTAICACGHTYTHTYTLPTPTHRINFIYEQNCHYPMCKYLQYWHFTFLFIYNPFSVFHIILFYLNKTLHCCLQRAKGKAFIKEQEEAVRCVLPLFLNKSAQSSQSSHYLMLELISWGITHTLQKKTRYDPLFTLATGGKLIQSLNILLFPTPD